MDEAVNKDRGTKELIRLVKLWNIKNNVGLRSLHLEMRTAKRVIDSPPIIRLLDIAAILRSVSGLTAMNDPSSYDGRRIPALSSGIAASSAKDSIDRGIYWADKALEAQTGGDNFMLRVYLGLLFGS